MVGPQLRVLLGEAGKPRLLDVGLAVPVGVLHPHDASRQGDDDAAAPRLDARRKEEVIAEVVRRLEISVAVAVLEQSHARQRGLPRLGAVGIVAHFDDPHSPVSSKAIATGSRTCGSAAASSTLSRGSASFKSESDSWAETGLFTAAERRASSARRHCGARQHSRAPSGQLRQQRRGSNQRVRTKKSHGAVSRSHFEAKAADAAVRNRRRAAFHEHLAGTRLDGRVGDLVAAPRIRASRGNVERLDTIGKLDHERRAEGRTALDRQAEIDEHLAGQTDDGQVLSQADRVHVDRDRIAAPRQRVRQAEFQIVLRMAGRRAGSAVRRASPSCRPLRARRNRPFDPRGPP